MAAAAAASAAAPAADLPPLSFPSLRGRRILVTGGAGYIGSHTVLTLLQAGARVTVVDNLINASRESLARVERLAKEAASTQGAAQPEPIEFHEVDLRHFDALERVFAGALAAGSSFDACIHFAGLKAVGESVRKPLAYYEHNVVGTLNLLKLLEKFGCRNLVFSSSATVYGLAECNPIPETAPLSTTNPYGQTKLVIEEILRDLARAPVVPPQQGVRAMVSADAALGSPAGPWRIVLLRYFNPIGAHPSGLIGEDPLGIPNNLLPFVMQVAVGRREKVAVFAEPPFDTPDGTGVRDYIHVMDLAEGHLAALEQGVFGSALQQSGAGAAQGSSACDVFNLGTGAGVSVLDMLSAARRASGRAIAHEIVPRRPGDIATCYADASKAEQKLHFHTRRSLDQGVADSWRWQSQNPNGYAAAAAPQAGEQK